VGAGIFCVVLTDASSCGRGNVQAHGKSVSNFVDLGGSVALTADSLTYLGPIKDWRDGASCRDTDPDLFFPVGTTGAAVDQIAAAKAVCDACPAKEPCLQFAIENNQDSGVWGGRRAPQAAPCVGQGPQDRRLTARAPDSGVMHS
jgi:WhiB family redox-sensing transcriptional regulator